MKNTLESHKFFPYFAWAVIGIGAFCTYTLALSVQSDLDSIGDGVARLEQRLNELDAKNMQQSETTTTKNP